MGRPCGLEVYVSPYPGCLLSSHQDLDDIFEGHMCPKSHQNQCIMTKIVLASKFSKKHIEKRTDVQTRLPLTT